MSRARIAMPMIILLIVVVGLWAWAIYATIIGGITSGPDFVQAMKSGRVSLDSISSIEVVTPAVGHTPFTASEYDSLPRQTRITGEASIRRLLTLLESFQPGQIHQNHPVNTYQIYLKVNLKDGFFWLYGDVYKDDRGAVFVLSANTRNAVNPNGASTYHLDGFSEFLRLLQHDKNTEPDSGGNR